MNAGVKADLVIGQPDLVTALVNYPSNSPTQANAQGLWSPEGLAVDADGNLYVADTCNARVVRFPAPFAQTTGVGLPQANLVLGQTSLFGQPIKDVSGQTMKSSYGLAFTAAGDLVVSDPLANRVLYFRKEPEAIFNPVSPRAMFSASPISTLPSPVSGGPASDLARFERSALRGRYRQQSHRGPAERSHGRQQSARCCFPSPA